MPGYSTVDQDGAIQIKRLAILPDGTGRIISEDRLTEIVLSQAYVKKYKPQKGGFYTSEDTEEVAEQTEELLNKQIEEAEEKLSVLKEKIKTIRRTPDKEEESIPIECESDGLSDDSELKIAGSTTKEDLQENPLDEGPESDFGTVGSDEV